MFEYEITGYLIAMSPAFIMIAYYSGLKLQNNMP